MGETPSRRSGSPPQRIRDPSHPSRAGKGGGMGRAQQGRRILCCLHKRSIFAEKRVNCMYFRENMCNSLSFGSAAACRRRKPPACGGQPRPLAAETARRACVLNLRRKAETTDTNH